MSSHVAAVMRAASRQLLVVASAYGYQTTLAVGRLRLHVFWRGDPGEAAHDHPWDFATLPLRPYVEQVMDPVTGAASCTVVPAWRVSRRRAEHAHKVLGRWAGRGFDTRPGAVVTICWRGKHRRAWYYLLLRAGRVRRVPPKQYLTVAEKHPLEAA